MRIFFAASLLMAAWLSPAFAAGCGLAPAQPKLPSGCRAMTPTCVCDSKACHWEFICVRQ